MKILSVNIDHVSSLRSARKEKYPEPIKAAILVELAGADGITVHLREDRRHIREKDISQIKEIINIPLTVEVGLDTKRIEFLLDIKPHQITLVPEVTTEVTTTRGFNIKNEFNQIKPFIEKIKKADILVSLFIEPNKENCTLAKKIGADIVELNTNKLTHSTLPNNLTAYLKELEEVAKYAYSNGLKVHVGHGLDYSHIKFLKPIEVITGYSIGFSIITRSLYEGISRAVKDMLTLIKD